MSEPTYVDLINQATELGRETGEDAASWYFDNNGDTETQAERVILGINDGDPEVLDGLPWPNLSGEWAGQQTPASLAEEIGLDLTDDSDEMDLDDCCHAWEDAASGAVERTVLRDAYRIVLPSMLEGLTKTRREADANWLYTIREAHELADMTQAAIGTHAGVSQQRIAQILSNNDEKGTAA